MRVLYHHRTRAEDGQAVHIRALQRAFEEEQHELLEVSLVASDDSAAAELGGSRRSWGWVAHLPRFMVELAEYGYGAAARSRIVGAAARFEPDFIYERYAFGNAAGVLAARRTGLPIVLEVNSPMVLELSRTRGLAFPRLARRLEDFVFRSADLVCAVTGVLRDMLIELGVDRERILVTPNGVHEELYRYDDRDAVRSAARRSLDVELTEDEVLLGFVGYYRDWHRLDLAIDALARPELEGTHLVLVGEGPAHDALASLAHERGVSRRVHFAGPRPHGEIPGLLPAFDVALLPAINPYASPLKLIEYMAAGLAIVAPDQPNLRELLDSGENAVLFPEGDGEMLRRILTHLTADPARRARLGAAARERVIRDDLTWRGNVRRVVQAVRELDAGRGRE